MVQWVSTKINALLTEISMRTGLNLNKPSYICAQMTMRCNSRCAHCNIWQMEFAKDELTTSQWLKALEDLCKWLGRFTMVFTGGEALLRNDMITILEHAVSLGIKVELLTNGLIVDNSLAKKIASSGIAQVTLSFDGINSDIHDRFRGESGFHQKTSEAIFFLRDNRDRHGKPLRILLKTVISRNNIEELVEIALFAQANALEVRYQPIEQNYGEEPDPEWYKKSEFWVDDLALLRSTVDNLKRLKSTGAPIANSADELDTFVDYFGHPERLMDFIQSHDTNTPSRYCRHALTNFVISSNGDVRMCFRMAPIGNLSFQQPKEIWDGRPSCWAKRCQYR